MLGKLEIVKAALSAYPEAKNTLGPHGIPLITHAQADGEEAKVILDYLTLLERHSPDTRGRGFYSLPWLSGHV
jgi:hypothetical protein